MYQGGLASHFSPARLHSGAFEPYINFLHGSVCWSTREFSPILKSKEDPWEKLDEFAKFYSPSPIISPIFTRFISTLDRVDWRVIESYLKAVKRHGISYLRVLDPLNDPENLNETFRICERTEMPVCGVIFIRPRDPSFVDSSGWEHIAGYKNLRSLVLYEPTGMIRLKMLRKLMRRVSDVTSVSIELALAGNSSSALYPCLYEAISTDINLVAIDASIRSSEGLVAPPNALLLMRMIHERHEIDDSNTLSSLAKIRMRSGEFDAKSINQWPMKGETESDECPSDFPVEMTTKLTNVLRTNNLSNYRSKALNELRSIHSEIGYIPLISPFSEALISQSIFNVLSDSERYQTMSPEFKLMLEGFFGQKLVESTREIHIKMISFPSLKETGAETERALPKWIDPGDPEKWLLSIIAPREAEGFLSSFNGEFNESPGLDDRFLIAQIVYSIIAPQDQTDEYGSLDETRGRRKSSGGPWGL
ncbi:MAG TPA: hypothetical protein VJ044_00765, partial [Candidatus Hodarchaeales archaeon]|nr:hypothetical protein [Candidatus Hodarchaeales archaeon]